MGIEKLTRGGGFMVLMFFLSTSGEHLPVERIHSCNVIKYTDTVYAKNIIDKDIGSKQRYDFADCVQKCRHKARCRAISIAGKQPGVCLMHSTSFTENMDSYVDHRGSVHATVECAKHKPSRIPKEDKKPTQFVSSDLQPSVHQTEPVQCGRQAERYRAHLMKHRIIGGRAATPHSWPWLVHLRIDTGNGTMATCGANILRVKDGVERSDILLTAAHCVAAPQACSTCTKENSPPEPVSAEQITAVAGQHSTTENEQSKVMMKVDDVQIHVGYRKLPGIQHDIALLRLSSPLSFNDFIRPVCLPVQDEEPPTGKHCMAAGWGRFQSHTLETPSILQEVIAPVHDQSVCKFSWKDVFVAEQMICAGSFLGESGTCNGDSGGMLACQQHDHSWTLYGMPSVGVNGVCVMAGHPPVFTRVSSYVDQIMATASKMTRVIQSRL